MYSYTIQYVGLQQSNTMVIHCAGQHGQAMSCEIESISMNDVGQVKLFYWLESWHKE